MTLISFTTPAAGEGISIVALSDSSVISDCSLETASPGLTSTSMTSTSLKSPISGTGTVRSLDASVFGFCSPLFSPLLGFSSASSSRIGVPCDTLSPIFTFNSLTTPAAGDGISIVALSDSSVISDCSLDTASPGFTSTSMTSTSLKSPMSGTTT